MNIPEARVAIEAILAAIDDESLPLFDKVEHDEQTDGPLVWWGSHGYVIRGSRDGQGNQTVPNYRADGSWKAVEMEMVNRYTVKHFAERPVEAAS